MKRLLNEYVIIDVLKVTLSCFIFENVSLSQIKDNVLGYFNSTMPIDW